MTTCQWFSARRIARGLSILCAAFLLVTACGGGGGGGGGDDEGSAGTCGPKLIGRSQALAVNCNGVPPDALDGLSIEATLPRNGDVGVSVAAVVQITFNKAMTVSPSFVVMDGQGREVAGSVKIEASVVTFTPTSPLAFATTYSVIADGGSAEGFAYCGILVQARCRVELAFTTLASPTAPAIGFTRKSISLPLVAVGGSTNAVQAGIVNPGGGRLTGLSVKGISYKGTSSGWITSAVLDASTAPTTLTLSFSTESLDAGDYVAIVEVASPVATNRSASFEVTLKVDVAAGPGPLSPTSALQAKKIAARSVNAMFVIDELVWLAIGNNFGSLGSADLAFGASTLTCSAGTGRADVIDSDGSLGLTTGDRVDYAFATCRPTEESPWTLDGTSLLTVLPGTNSDAVWREYAPGVLAFRFAADGLQVSNNGSLALSYQTAITVSTAVFLTQVEQATAMAQATLSLAGTSTSLTGASFSVGSDAIVRALQGVASTAIEGVGTLRSSMSSPNGLVLGSDPGNRYRPISGTVRLASADRTVWVDYGASGAVTLRVDDGNDGTIDRTVNTSVTELDSLLSVR